MVQEFSSREAKFVQSPMCDIHILNGPLPAHDIQKGAQPTYYTINTQDEPYLKRLRKFDSKDIRHIKLAKETWPE